MKNLISRHPLLLSVLIILAYDLGMQGLKVLLRFVSFLHTSQLATSVIVQGVFSVLIIALIARLRWWRDTGFVGRVTRRALLAYSPWIVLPLLMLADSGKSSAGLLVVVGFAAMMFMVGFAEEALLRGVVLRALLPSGVMRAAILSSLIFGLAHLTNIFQGRDATSTVVQAVYATFIGIGFAGPRLYTGTIWPAIVLHGLIDFSDAASRGFSPANETKPVTFGQAITVIVITGLYALYGFWLARKHQKRHAKSVGDS
jgi:membrane protease YdiL (CAAX protease family)